MRIEHLRALPGPNVYVDRPVLRARIELEDLTETESYEVPGFPERLLARLPGLREHHCAKGAPGGFVERLDGGTYFGHVLEHVALELNQAVGIGVNFGRTVYAGAPGRYDVIVEYRNEPVGRFLLHVALELVQALAVGAPYPLEEKLAEARRLRADTDLGPSSQAIVAAAERRGIPWIRLDDHGLVQLGYGVHRRLVSATLSHRTSCIAVDIAGDKALTKRLLDQAGIPVPRGVVVRSADEAVAALNDLRPPLAVKPLDANQGKGVSLRLTTPAEVAAAYAAAAAYSRSVVVEEFFAGRDYRVKVVDGRLVAASERIPAHVVGDGARTIAELIDRENQNPLRGEGHEKCLTRIRVDAIAAAFLGRAGRRLTDVPARGERVFLRETANLSTGATARDVTDEVHPEVARTCERAARVIGLDVCGIDLITPDIARPLPGAGAGIIEVNAAPGIRMHHHPSEGRPRDVGAAIVEMLYPAGAPARIPIVSITGTNGKTTTARMVGHVLGEAGRVVGMTTTDGIYIDGRRVVEGDTTGFQSARTVLGDPLVEVAVLETARGGILRRSLGYDWSDVGVLTNIQGDHLGQDGIEGIEDLLHVKALVAERVREGGTLVLNADDERLARLTEMPRVARVPKRVVYFSLLDGHPLLQRHTAAGGTAYCLHDGWLVEMTRDRFFRIVRESAIPATLGGAAPFQTANALAAAAAGRALGLTRGTVAAGLAGFHNDRHNPGRLNFFRVGRGYLVVDYGHNPSAFEAMSTLAARWRGERRVTGVFTVPGDRWDDLIEQGGRTLARGFPRLFIREDQDLRGRRRGEVADLLCRAIHDEMPGHECRVVLDEAAALATALDEMEDEEVVVLSYEDWDAVQAVLRRYEAVPVPAIEHAPMAHAV